MRTVHIQTYKLSCEGIEQREHSQKLDEGIIPLINLVFLLLIFFLVEGSLSEITGQELMPPVSTREVSVPEQGDNRLRLSINAQGEIFWLGQPTHLDQLEQLWFSQGFQPDENMRVTIDAKAKAKDILPLLDTLRASGVVKVTFTTLVTRAD